MSNEAIKINYVPHINTIINKQSHFSRLCDAVAEFIDNSIQACSNNNTNDIKINFFLEKNNTINNNNSYLVISDNGKITIIIYNL